MNKWFKIGSVAALVAVVALVALGAGAAFAQGPAATPPAPGLGLHMGPQNSLVAIAAKTLNISVTDLVAELRAGKTIAEVAKAKNVEVNKIIDAVVANHTAAIKAAVDAKRITQAQADAELAKMKTEITEHVNGKWTPRGAGYGMGRGMGAGMGAGFVDANKDGVCDNCGANRPAGHGAGFVDANKDGVCDNCGANRPAGQPFMGRGRWATK